MYIEVSPGVRRDVMEVEMAGLELEKADCGVKTAVEVWRRVCGVVVVK